MEMMDDSEQQMATVPDMTAAPVVEERDPAGDRALVSRIIKTVQADKKHHEKPFKRMRRDMHIAMWGSDTEWDDSSYKANVTGRHVKQKTSSLYAKNPKAVARARETMDFEVWDENPESLVLAMQTMQAGMQAAQVAQTQPMVDDMTGQPVVDEMGNVLPSEPQLPPGFEQAQAVIADFQQGMERKSIVKKFGRTLELLFAQAQRDQKPVDFKGGMKQTVRRACTTGVGYVKLGFQREMGQSSTINAQLNDFRDRLNHLRVLAEKAAEGEIDEISAEMAELELSVNALQNEPEVIIREGLVIEFPQSTRVIPDKLCTQLMGFVNSRHLTVEYIWKKSEIQEKYGVDLGKDYTPYSQISDESADGRSSENFVGSDQGELFEDRSSCTGDDLVCVWEYYDKPSGLVYVVCDGHKNFLKPPAPPDVFVTDFWPVYALTFNAVESEKEVFPPSDVTLLLEMQKEYNRSRQGKREHRQAARPRWAFAKGALDESDIDAFKRAEPFEAFSLGMDPTTKLTDILQPVPVPGVDPNLYDVNEIFSDMQLVVGTQQAQLGGLSKASATESAISAGATASGDASSIDDLDAFLTCIARASGQILMKEMSEEQVKRIAGRGAVWLTQSEIDIYDEITLEVEAGSTGKPNQAVEMANWEKMAPLLVQLPGISPVWLARETIRRLDDKADLTEALAAGMPSVVMQNSMTQPSTGDPASDPNAQGAEGGDNAPPPPGGPSGTGPAFGSNQV